MKFSAPLLLFPISLLVALLLLVSPHLMHKPRDQEWSRYEPGFLYAMAGSVSALAERSCESDLLFGVGSSIFDTAFARNDGNWRRWNRWRRYDGALGKNLQVTAIARTATRDLLMVYPILSILPDCEKTLLISSELFLSSPARIEATRLSYAREYLLESSRFYFGYLLEQIWPKTYQLPFHKQLKHRRKKATRVNPWKKAADIEKNHQREAFTGIQSQHRDILQRLVDNGARIIILDIAHGPEEEMVFKSGLVQFRRALQAFADKSDSTHFLHFRSLDESNYTDGAHMNRQGANTFRRWLVRQLRKLRSEASGIR